MKQIKRGEKEKNLKRERERERERNGEKRGANKLQIKKLEQK